VLQRGKHFGAAACFQMLDEAPRRVEILRAGRKRLRRKLIKFVVEGQNAETIVCAKPVERLKQRLNEALTLLPNEAEIPELLQKIAALVERQRVQPLGALEDPV